MDLNLGVGFLLGIIGAGFGVVLEQVIVGHFRRGNLLRALRVEIRENMTRLGGPKVAAPPGAPMVRAAWDSAHILSLPDPVFGAVALAYAHAAELEAWASLILGRVTYRGVAWRWGSEYRARNDAIAKARERAQAAYDAFASAIALLEHDI